MIQQVLLPKLGETMTEATVEKWRKAEGDKIQKGEVLLEITTDKATLEVESLFSGTVRKVLAAKGAVLPVNTVIALVGEPNDALPANLNELAAVGRGEQPAAAPKAGAATPTQAAAVETAAPAIAEAGGRQFVSPRARKLAEAEKVPLQALRGSGPGGRVVEQDVTAYVARRNAVKSTPAAAALAFERGVDITSIKGTGPEGRVTKEDILAAKPAVATASAATPAAGRIELSAMRRVVADRMTKSKRETPHFYLMMDIDMTAAAALRKKLNESGKTRIAFHDIIIRACAKAMLDNPAMNVAWGGDHIRQRGEVNIGLAVALEEGLIVPVVKNAHKLTLEQTAQASARLVEKARSKKLTPDEYEGGCMTLSNLGMYDVENFLPVINLGESCILGTGRIAQKVVVVDGAIGIRSIMSVTLSADHRATDGAIAAKFLKAVKDYLEKPESQG